MMLDEDEMMNNVTKLTTAKAATTTKAKKRRAAAKKIKAPGASREKIAVGVMTLALLAVSLTDLARGIAILTACAEWQSWALALAVDGLMVAVEYGMLVQSRDCYGDALVGLVAVVSAGLNALAMSGGDVANRPMVSGLGVLIPLAMWLAAHRLAGLKRAANGGASAPLTLRGTRIST